MNKSKLLERIIEALHDSLAVLEKASRAAHAEATHESSKAENKYDIRGGFTLHFGRVPDRYSAFFILHSAFKRPAIPAAWPDLEIIVFSAEIGRSALFESTLEHQDFSRFERRLRWQRER